MWDFFVWNISMKPTVYEMHAISKEILQALDTTVAQISHNTIQ